MEALARSWVLVTHLWSGGVGLRWLGETHRHSTSHHDAEPRWGSANRSLSTFLSTAKRQGTKFEKKKRSALLMDFYTSLQKRSLTFKPLAPSTCLGPGLVWGAAVNTEMNRAWLCSQGAHRPVEESTTHSLIKC